MEKQVRVRKPPKVVIQFSIWKRGVFRRGKEIKGLRGGVHQYAAQERPQIDAATAEKNRFQTETSYKNRQAGQKNNLLIFRAEFYILRVMARFLVLIIGIVWASLLLISWGSADDLPRPTAEIIQSRSS